jgi:hypothetical protein
MRLGDFRYQIEAFTVTQTQIHEDNVGVGFFDCHPGFTHRSGLAAASHSLLLVEPLGEAAAKEGVVFDDENADFFHSLDFGFRDALKA